MVKFGDYAAQTSQEPAKYRHASRPFRVGSSGFEGRRKKITFTELTLPRLLEIAAKSLKIGR